MITIFIMGAPLSQNGVTTAHFTFSQLLNIFHPFCDNGTPRYENQLITAVVSLRVTKQITEKTLCILS